MRKASRPINLKSARTNKTTINVASEAIVVVDIVESTLATNLFGWYAVGRGLMRELRNAIRLIGAKYKLLCMKSTGDGYLLAYGYTKSAELSAIHAVDASLELLKFLRNYNRKRTTAEEQRVSVRIAIHFGQVDVVENDREGPDVSYAFRLEAINRESLRDAINAVPPDELPLRDYILCSESVRNILGRRGYHLAMKQLGLFKFRGFPHLHEVFLLQDERKEPT